MRDRKINVKRRPYYNVWNFYSVADFENIVVVLVEGSMFMEFGEVSFL